MNKSEFIRNASPEREKIISMLAKKDMSAAKVGEVFGWTREKAYNALNKMERAGLIAKKSIDGHAMWCKRPPKPKPVVRETPVLTGTMKGALSLSYMNNVHRPGAMDAFAIKSKGLLA